MAEAPVQLPTLRELIEARLDAHDRAHMELAESIKSTFAAHERLHESQAESATERFLGHRSEHDAHNTAHTREHVMTQTALDKAEASMDRRLATMNEFRAALDDANKIMMGRAESLGMHGRTAERIDEIKHEIQAVREALTAMGGSMRQERAKEIAAAVMPLGDRLAVVEAFMIRTGGRDQGIGSVWGWILAGAGLIGTILGILYALSQAGT